MSEITPESFNEHLSNILCGLYSNIEEETYSDLLCESYLKLHEENQRLREALKFYSDYDIYNDACDGRYAQSSAEKDEGNIAREALKESKE